MSKIQLVQQITVANILLCPAVYCVKLNTVSTLVFNIHLFNFHLSTCCSRIMIHPLFHSTFQSEFIAFNRLSAFWGGKCWFFSIYKVASFTDSLLIKITFLLRERKRKKQWKQSLTKYWENQGFQYFSIVLFRGGTFY